MVLLTIFYLFRNGKSKGIAYVEFEQEKSAQAAVLKVDQNEFMGRVVRFLSNLIR